MKKQIRHLLTAVLVVGCTIVLTSPVRVGAEETGTKTATQSETKRQQLEEKKQEEAQKKKQEAQAKAKEREAAAKDKLKNEKQKLCEKKQEKVSNAMTRISDRGQKQLGVFTKISERVQKFYLDKGKVLDNYDALVADVSQKKEAAETALEAIKTSPDNYTCNDDNAQEYVQTFKQNHKIATDALKEYKTAVKNLIVGVKSVQGTASRENGDLQ